MEIFAKRLKQLRTSKGLSLEALSKVLGSSTSIISYWENNKSEPTALYLVALSDFFEVSVDYLLGKADH